MSLFHLAGQGWIAPATERNSNIPSRQRPQQQPPTYQLLVPEKRSLSVQQLLQQGRTATRGRRIPGTPWPKLETGAGPADHYLPHAHRALWSECQSEDDWHFRHFPVWVRTGWPNPWPRPSILPKIFRETSANMASWCWSGDQAAGFGRRPLPDGWLCGINRTEDLTCMPVDRWRRRRGRSNTGSWKTSWRGLTENKTLPPAGDRRKTKYYFL